MTTCRKLVLAVAPAGIQGRNSLVTSCRKRRSARRYRSTTDPRRNFVVYDLADPSAADVRVPATPWTLRIKESWAALDRGVYRALGPTVTPDRAD